MTKEKREEALLELYDFEVKQGRAGRAQLTKQGSEDREYFEKVDIMEYWAQKGIVKIGGQASGFTLVELTAYGIDYVENNLL
ncbi:hypothetical protein [Aneurinibacillus aneurinilyticus]|uniref:hypothetical protein n=1 Tax=Aneurinibacillus aneurinilyticus TaxID=1391 RepID=UPI0036728B05